MEAVHLVLSPPATVICRCCWVLGCCSHASMIPARGTYVCAADTNMGLQLTGIFGYRLAGKSVGHFDGDIAVGHCACYADHVTGHGIAQADSGQPGRPGGRGMRLLVRPTPPPLW